MTSVIVVGAGIGGIAAACALREQGVDVTVLDRGHHVGGRMASRVDGERVVDTGASYFTVSDDAFRSVVDDWERRGLARPWTDTFVVADGGELTPKSGPVRWAAPGGLRSLVEDLASGLTIERHDVERVVVEGERAVVDGRPADAVVLAMPDPQARRLVAPDTAVYDALDDPFQPVLALVATWPTRSWPDVDGVFVSDSDVLEWVADDGRRRGDGAPVLVAHSTSAFAEKHLETPREATAAMTDALRAVLGIASPPDTAWVHRWSFAKPSGTHDATYLLDGPIGVCGDAWSDKPRVESAWLSGRALGTALLDRGRQVGGVGVRDRMGGCS